MNDDDMIKQQIREAFEPMFTEVVELEVKVISSLTKNFPADMSETGGCASQLY